MARVLLAFQSSSSIAHVTERRDAPAALCGLRPDGSWAQVRELEAPTEWAPIGICMVCLAQLADRVE